MGTLLPYDGTDAAARGVLRRRSAVPMEAGGSPAALDVAAAGQASVNLLKE